MNESVTSHLSVLQSPGTESLPFLASISGPPCRPLPQVLVVRPPRAAPRDRFSFKG